MSHSPVGRHGQQQYHNNSSEWHGEQVKHIGDSTVLKSLMGRIVRIVRVEEMFAHVFEHCDALLAREYHGWVLMPEKSSEVNPGLVLRM